MKIFAIADIHIEGKNKNKAYQLPDIISKKNYNKNDVLVIAGDISPFIGSFHKYLSLFKKIQINKLFVAGNHDIWVNKEGDSKHKYYTQLKEAVLDAGFCYLDSNPIIINQIGFIGNIGWYDYSFKQNNLYLLDNCNFIRCKNNQIIKWDDLNDEDYSEKILCSINNGKYQIFTSWNDRIYINWEYRDKEFADICYNKIKDDFDLIDPYAKEIVFISHHIHFYECIVQKKIPEWDFNNAFMGCKVIGDLIKTNQKVSKIIFGHSHVRGKWIINDKITAYNPVLINNDDFYIINI
jgi:Icc-related predicted phosphoesterase